MQGWRAGAIACVVACVGCTPIVTSTPTDAGAVTTTSHPLAQPGDPLPELRAARQLLLDLEPLASDGYWTENPYERAAFGPAWIDVDHNRCNTRDDELEASLTDVVLRSNGCYVDHGTLVDPYTGEVIAFQRGQDTSPLVQIDHVVSLWEAWGAGAATWTEQDRIAFANDPMNLLPTAGAVNEAKGAASIAEWLPPAPGAVCDFARRVVGVKAKYGLAITVRDRSAVGEALDTCTKETPRATPTEAARG